MSNILYSNVNISVFESDKEILINPSDERFYNIGCDEMECTFFSASLYQDDNGQYIIEGTQKLYNEYNTLGYNYEKLLCLYPKELIKKSSLFFLFGIYSVKGIHKREVISRYVCKNREYKILQRAQILSNEFIDSDE